MPSRPCLRGANLDDVVGALDPRLVDKLCPILHELPPLLDRRPAPVIGLNAFDFMAQRRLGDLARRMGAITSPISKTRSETMRNAVETQLLYEPAEGILRERFALTLPLFLAEDQPGAASPLRRRCEDFHAPARQRHI